MADLSLRYLLYGEDKTASKAIKGVGTQASSTASLVSGGMSKMGSMVGGEVGDMLNRVSMGFDQIGEKSKGMGAKLVIGGAAVTGLGLAMQTMASKDVESMNQLNAAVEATGKGYEGFGADVEKLIESQVAFGNTDDEVTTSLRVLTQAYGDPKRALQEMGLVTDLAAAKHISLADAAGMVAKAHGGAGRVFKEFGIVVGTNTDGTKNYDGALTALSGKLKGQASASMDSFGGKVRQAKAWIENQASAISQKLGPALTVAGPLMAGVGSVMQVMAARSAAAAVAAGAQATATEGATIATKGMAAAQGLLTAASGPVGLALAGVALVAGVFIKNSMDAKARVDELAATLDKQTGALTENSRAVVAKSLADNGAYVAAQKMGIALADVTDAALGGVDASRRVAAGMDAYGKSSLTAGIGAAEAGNNINSLSNAIGVTTSDTSDAVAKGKLFAEGMKTSSTATQDLAGAQKDMAAKTKAATDAVKSYLQSLVDAGLAVLSTRSAQRQLTQSVADASDKLKNNGKTLDINTQKGRDNQASLDSQADAAIGLAKSVGVGTDSQGKFRASLLSSRGSLVQTAINFGMTKAQANAYADQVLKIPPAKKTKVTADTAGATTNVSRFDRQLHDLPDMLSIDINFTSNFSWISQQIAALQGAKNKLAANGPGHARGTSFFGGGATWVGEEGPELVMPPRGSVIASNQTSRSMMAGGSGGGDIHIHVNGQIYGGPAQLAAAILPGLQQLKGRGVQLGLT